MAGAAKAMAVSNCARFCTGQLRPTGATGSLLPVSTRADKPPVAPKLYQYEDLGRMSAQETSGKHADCLRTWSRHVRRNNTGLGQADTQTECLSEPSHDRTKQATALDRGRVGKGPSATLIGGIFGSHGNARTHFTSCRPGFPRWCAAEDRSAVPPIPPNVDETWFACRTGGRARLTARHITPMNKATSRQRLVP